MRFDPSLAAQEALVRIKGSPEVRDDLISILEAEAVFSDSVGDAATAAYEELQGLGRRYPDVESLQAFLIYITWQQATEDTVPKHFRTGLDLCRRYLAQWGNGSEAERIRELSASYQHGLGEKDDEEGLDYDRDVLKGGD